MLEHWLIILTPTFITVGNKTLINFTNTMFFPCSTLLSIEVLAVLSMHLPVSICLFFILIILINFNQMILLLRSSLPVSFFYFLFLFSFLFFLQFFLVLHRRVKLYQHRLNKKYNNDA